MLRADIKAKALQVLSELTPASDKERELIATLHKAVSEDDVDFVNDIATSIFNEHTSMLNPIMPALDWVCSVVYSWNDTYPRV